MKNTKNLKPAVKAAAKKTTTLELAGNTVRLAFDFNQIVRTEPEARCNLLAGLQDIANLSALQLRGLFVAAVRAADPKSTMTIEQAGKLIRFNTIIPISEALAESILLSIPKKEGQAA
jgi:hypothetical protein